MYQYFDIDIFKVIFDKETPFLSIGGKMHSIRTNLSHYEINQRLLQYSFQKQWTISISIANIFCKVKRLSFYL